MTRRASRINSLKLSLQPILIFSLILQIIFTVGLTGYFSWRNGQKTVKSLALHLSREITDRTKDCVNNFINIPTLFLEINQAFVKLDNLNLENFANLKKNFWLQTQLIPQVNTLYYANEQGDFIQVEMQNQPKLTIRDRATAPNWKIYNLDGQGNQTTLIATEKYDPRLRPWYRAAIKTQKIVWSPVYLFADPPVLGITPAMAIFDQRTGKPQGVMAIDLTLGEISEFLSSLSIGDSGKAFIMEQSGEIIALSTQASLVNNAGGTNQRLHYINTQDYLINSTVASLKEKFSDFAKLNTEQQLVLSLKNQRYFVQIAPLVSHPGLNWLMVVIIPESDFMEYTRRNTRATIFLCLIVLLLATLLGAIINQWIFRSIFRLSHASQAISQGKFSSITNLPKIKELALLTVSFNSLVQQLQSSEETNLRIEQRAEEKNNQLQLAKEQWQRLAVIDSLTGIFNRYYFDLTLSQLWWKNLVSKKPISLILCDVDYFKLYNDTYGHQQGDICLRQVAQTIKNILQRQDDIVARYGGEEFVVILPNTNPSGAIAIATRIQEGIQAQKITHAPSPVNEYVTISCGVACIIPNPNSSTEKLLEQADIALYQAKKQGRNLIIFRDQ
jgi:diguanylate cyclase (GGDEF)-like protein